MTNLTAGTKEINGITFEIKSFTDRSELDYDYRIIQHGFSGGYKCIDGICEGDAEFCQAWISRKSNKHSLATIKLTYTDGYQELRKIDILEYDMAFSRFSNFDNFKETEIVPMMDVRQLECEITSVLEIR